MSSITALFVASGGVYFGLPGVDPWDEVRDARLYAGSDPVVAHPPCERWGRYWSGGPSAKLARLRRCGGAAVCLSTPRRVTLSQRTACTGRFGAPDGSPRAMGTGTCAASHRVTMGTVLASLRGFTR